MIQLAKKKDEKSTRLFITIVFCMLLLLGVVFLVYQYRKPPRGFPAISAYTHKLKAWMSERKSHLQQGLKEKTIQKPKLAHKNELREPVHFEFYTALPNMQMAPRELAEKVPVPSHDVKASQTIINAEELEREFAERIKASKNHVKVAQG